MKSAGAQCWCGLVVIPAAWKFQSLFSRGQNTARLPPDWTRLPTIKFTMGNPYRQPSWEPLEPSDESFHDPLDRRVSARGGFGPTTT